MDEYYSYAWLPVSKEEKCIGSISLADTDVHSRHARLYYMDPQKDHIMTTAEAESMADNPSMELLIIVNIDDGYKFQGLSNQRWKTPVIIVTAKTGCSIRKYVCTPRVQKAAVELFLIGKTIHGSVGLGTKGYNYWVVLFYTCNIPCIFRS